MTAASAAPQENFFEKVWDEIENLFKKATTIEQDIATFANNVVNKLVALQGNQTVQFLESDLVTIAESINPALTPMISGIELELPKILTIIKGGVAEASKTDSEQLNDFITYIETLKGITGTVYAGLLGTLNAAVQNYITSNAGIVVAPSKLLATGQVV